MWFESPIAKIFGRAWMITASGLGGASLPWALAKIIWPTLWTPEEVRLLAAAWLLGSIAMFLIALLHVWHEEAKEKKT